MKRFTQDEICEFDEKGYIFVGQLITQETVEELRNAIERVYQGQYNTGQKPDAIAWRPDHPDALAVRKIDNSWKADAFINAFLRNPQIGFLAAQLLRTDIVQVWHDQILHKPPNGGKVVTWHQDWNYWQLVTPSNMVTCWIALDDVAENSGPMEFLEGTHKMGLFERPPVISGENAMEPKMPDGQRVRKVQVTIPAGHATFHHCLTLHGSGRNFSAHPRRAFVIHIMDGHCRYRSGFRHSTDHAWTLNDGDVFRGEQWPILWQATSSRET